MAAVPWKPVFWERFHDSFSIAGVVRDSLALVSVDLASPLRGGEEDGVLEDCDKKLSEASNLLGFAISALGTVELLSLRCMRTDDAAEVQARTRACAATEMASNAYSAVASSRGHLGAAGRLIATTGIPFHAVDQQRVAVLEALEAAGELLEGMRALGASISAVAVPRPNFGTRSEPEAAAPNLVGARGATTSDAAAWLLLGGSVPGALLGVALSGALPEIEAAQAALRIGADAVQKSSKIASACYDTMLRALGAAHSALSSLLALRTQADIVLLRCARELSLDRDGLGCLGMSWEASRAEAERHGRAALDNLWSASAFVDYCFAGVLAWRSPTSSSSGQEARELMRRALADAGKARDAGSHLRHAAGRQFLEAWNVLNCARSS